MREDESPAASREVSQEGKQDRPVRRRPRLRALSLRASSRALSFVVLDFNAYGLRIESRDPLQVGLRYEFSLELHETRIEIEAEVRWCKIHRTIEIGPSEFQSIYRAGLAFVSGPVDLLQQEDG